MSLDRYLYSTFLLSIKVSIVSAFMFLARVHWPDQPFQPAGIFGVIAILLGIPALGLVVVGINQHLGLSYWLMPLLYSIFATSAFLLDIVFKIEFRQPPRWPILLPFLFFYFVSAMGLWGMSWIVGLMRWSTAGVAYFSMVASAIYASGKGMG